jgi:hypothetical protein
MGGHHADAQCGWVRVYGGRWSGVYLRSNAGNAAVRTLDAAVVSPGVRMVVSGPDFAPQRNVSGGMHFCLFNNAWNTNYIQYYPYSLSTPWDSNLKFRFNLRFGRFFFDGLQVPKRFD